MVRNLTPHAVRLLVGGREVVLPPDGVVARVRLEQDATETIEWQGMSLPVREVSTKHQVVGLPNREEDTLFLVSFLVAQAAKERDDLLVVDHIDRSDEGVIQYVNAFAKVK